MKVVILAGGVGSRLSEETVSTPKPMVEIGGKPILWHIMKEYSYYGFNEFIICCGYKQHVIKEWFADYYLLNTDVTFDMSKGGEATFHKSYIDPWKVTCVDTGRDTMTGGRIKRIQKYVEDETFMLTYGDGVCDVDIRSILSFHLSHGKKATLTAVVQKETKGILEVNEAGSVSRFREKKYASESVINAGYMVLEPSIFDYLEDDSTVFEESPLQKLASEGELMSYRHEGFWQCMDTLNERTYLNRLVEANEAPWVKW